MNTTTTTSSSSSSMTKSTTSSTSSTSPSERSQATRSSSLSSSRWIIWLKASPDAKTEKWLAEIDWNKPKVGVAAGGKKKQKKLLGTAVAY